MLSDTMNANTRGERPTEGHGASIKVQGRTVHLTYALGFPAPGTLTVRFVSSSRRARQALRLAVKGGRLLVNGRSLDNVVLWRDTAPRVVSLQVVPVRRSCTVHLWNAWAEGKRIRQAGLGNGGMLVTPEPDGLRLECSAGVGAQDFRDLVVRIGVAAGARA
jgi:hypothetical protein